jgi:hypothetical protein
VDDEPKPANDQPPHYTGLVHIERSCVRHLSSTEAPKSPDTHGGGDRSVGACEEEKEKQAKERGFNLNSSLARVNGLRYLCSQDDQALLVPVRILDFLENWSIGF